MSKPSRLQILGMIPSVGIDDMERAVRLIKYHQAIGPLRDLDGKRRVDLSGVAHGQTMSARVKLLAHVCLGPRCNRELGGRLLARSVLAHVEDCRTFPSPAQIRFSVRHARYRSPRR